MLWVYGLFRDIRQIVRINEVCVLTDHQISFIMRHGCTITYLKPLLKFLKLRVHAVSREDGFAKIGSYPEDESWSLNPIFLLFEEMSSQQDAVTNYKAKSNSKNGDVFDAK